MLRSLISGQTDLRMTLISFLLSLPIVLISLTVHEYSHGYIAYKLGDPTAKNLGRLSLNPLKHLDPIGTICMLLTGFGWARPVPISVRHFKNPRRDMALSAIAGPVSNIILAFIGALLIGIYTKFTAQASQLTPGSFLYFFDIALYTFLYNFHQLNLCLAIFNLIPVPPLDGSRFFYVLLPDKWYFGVMKYERTIQIIVMIALFTGILTLPLESATFFVSRGMLKIIYLLLGL